MMETQEYTIGPDIPCYYDATPMQDRSGEGVARRLECPTCGLTVLYNGRNGTWLRIKDRKEGAA